MVAVIMAAAILAVMVSGTRMVAAGIMAGCGSQPEFDMVVRTSVRSRNAGVRPANFRNALNAHSSAFRNGRLLSNPAARAQIAAAAALAGWHGGSSGWWQHAGGGYGWVGPLFWPFAYNDIYDYTIWGDGLGFWGYGYPDIYAGIFGPYGYDGLSAYLPQRPQGRRQARGVALDQLVRQRPPRDRRPADRPDRSTQCSRREAQGASLDELGNASIQAADRSARPVRRRSRRPRPAGSTAMQQRIEAMDQGGRSRSACAGQILWLAHDEQKARFNALAEDQRRDDGVQQRPMDRWSRIAERPAGRAGMAAARDRGEASSQRHPARRAKGAPGYQRQGQRRSLKAACQPNERHDAAGADGCGPQAARRHARRRQVRARGAGGFLRHAERRAEGAVRGHRAAADVLSLSRATRLWRKTASPICDIGSLCWARRRCGARRPRTAGR